jgi:hypothetical protein
MISEPIACSAQTVRLSCVLIHIISKETKMSFHLTSHLRVPLVMTKNISKHVVHPVQNLHQSCAEINTVLKRSETSFHLTHVT